MVREFRGLRFLINSHILDAALAVFSASAVFVVGWRSLLIAIRRVGRGKQVYHSQRGELSLGRYEGWAGRNRRTLRKAEELPGRDTKGGVRETSLPFVVGETSLGSYEWQPGETMQTLRKTEKQDGVADENAADGNAADENAADGNAAEMNETRILRQKRNTMIQCNYKAIMLWLRPKRAQ